MTNIAPRDLALLLVVTLIWAFNLVASKVGVGYVPPILFTTLRFAILGAVLIPFLRVHRGHMGAMVTAALLSGALNFGLYFGGLKVAGDVSSVAIITQLGVPFTTLLSVAILGEVVRWRRWTGIVLSFLGVAIMGFDPRITQHVTGATLVAASAFMGALSLIAIKKLWMFRPLELQAWTAWVSWPPLLVASLIFERPTPEMLAGWPPLAWGCVAFTALGSSLIAHSSFYYLIRRYPVTSVAPLTVLSPIFSVIFGVTLLGDRITVQLLVGGAVTLVGVLIILLRERRIVDTGT